MSSSNETSEPREYWASHHEILREIAQVEAEKETLRGSLQSALPFPVRCTALRRMIECEDLRVLGFLYSMLAVEHENSLSLHNGVEAFAELYDALVGLGRAGKILVPSLQACLESSFSAYWPAASQALSRIEPKAFCGDSFSRMVGALCSTEPLSYTKAAEALSHSQELSEAACEVLYQAARAHSSPDVRRHLFLPMAFSSQKNIRDYLWFFFAGADDRFDEKEAACVALLKVAASEPRMFRVLLRLSIARRWGNCLALILEAIGQARAVDCLSEVEAYVSSSQQEQARSPLALWCLARLESPLATEQMIRLLQGNDASLFSRKENDARLSPSSYLSVLQEMGYASNVIVPHIEAFLSKESAFSNKAWHLRYCLFCLLSDYPLLAEENILLAGFFSSKKIKKRSD